ncbi:hypothetical protein ACIQRW_26175 [Streptomyces sp. NPDC091287]|uniref:hypothetical protein n=1 Tax=Streptomyces sp. NPDC091287 TaxID=3365988 RepID=UPI0038270738
MDPITLAGITAVALNEGVRFLYDQAGEVLRNYRERRAATTELPPELFESSSAEAGESGESGESRELVADLDTVARLESELRGLRRDLGEYGQGVDLVDPRDSEVLALVDGLRRTLEAVYGAPIVFLGEPRPDAVRIRGGVEVQEVRGYVAGVRGLPASGGDITGTVRADTVEEGGRAIGVDLTE